MMSIQVLMCEKHIPKKIFKRKAMTINNRLTRDYPRG